MLTIVIVVSAILGALIAHFSTQKKEEKVVTTPVETETKPAEETPKETRPANPEITDLVKIYEETGQEMIETILILKDGRKFICWAHRLVESGAVTWKASIGEKDSRKVLWNNRRQRAARVPEMELKPA